ncbi:MAG: isoprenyl transferase [Bacillota bacterium]
MDIPSHIAIIMDGNGRWAEERGLPRTKGHLAGVKALKSVTRRAGELGVDCLTVYAFSTENWKRPGPEVNFLMHLFKKTLLKQAADLIENNVKVKIIGKRDELSSGVLGAINEIENLTEKNHGLQLNIAFNYGGRSEIVEMFKKIYRNSAADIANLTEEDFSQYLYCNNFSDVELLIRTGGEKRLSNFLLWQSAYAELYFVNKYWPDFNGEELEKAIDVFKCRNRRFGGLKEKGEK